MEHIKEWCNEQIHELKRKAQDRNTWKEIVNSSESGMSCMNMCKNIFWKDISVRSKFSCVCSSYNLHSLKGMNWNWTFKASNFNSSAGGHSL